MKQFDRENQEGYLLIRFFDRFLLADLRRFLRAMVSKENYIKTKVSGEHWKFIIRFEKGQYIIVNQRDKNQFVVDEVTLDELKQKLNRVKEEKTVHSKNRSLIYPSDTTNEEVNLEPLREKLYK